MNKVALVEKLSDVMGTTKAEAERALDCVFDSIVSTLKKHEEVSIAGFGKFISKAKPARMARNPKTGEQVKVAASNAPKFTAAKALKDSLNGR